MGYRGKARILPSYAYPQAHLTPLNHSSPIPALRKGAGMSEAAISQARRAVPARAPFIFVIFLGSFLLFLIQPMFGRMILPRLGGAPAVWNTAMLLFQAMLLAGYLYAHFVSRQPLGRQLDTYLVAFLCGAATLPIGLAGFWPERRRGADGCRHRG